MHNYQISCNPRYDIEIIENRYLIFKRNIKHWNNISIILLNRSTNYYIYYWFLVKVSGTACNQILGCSNTASNSNKFTIFTFEYIYTYYPLCNNQPITRPHSHHEIGQYNLYFIHEKLYLKVLGKPSNIGYIWQFWIQGCMHLAHTTSGPARCQTFRKKKREYDEWH